MPSASPSGRLRGTLSPLSYRRAFPQPESRLRRMSNNAANSRPALALYIVIAASALLLVYFLTTGDAARKTEVFVFLGVPTMPLPFNDLCVPLGWLRCY